MIGVLKVSKAIFIEAVTGLINSDGRIIFSVFKVESNRASMLMDKEKLNVQNRRKSFTSAQPWMKKYSLYYVHILKTIVVY